MLHRGCSCSWTTSRVGCKASGYCCCGGSSGAPSRASRGVALGDRDDRCDQACRRAILSRSLFRPDRERHQCPHRVHRRAHHVSHDGLHRIRQPDDSRQCRHGQGRGVRRDLHRGRGLDIGDGALCQLSDRARPRHGPQCLLRFHRRADLQIYLAAGARRRVLLGRDFLPDLDLPAARIRHQFDTEKSQARDLRRRRAVPRDHRARGSQDRGGASGDAGHARRSQAMAGDPVPRRLHGDHRAQLPQHHRRHADRHPGGDARSACRSASCSTAASSRCRRRWRRRSCSSISRVSPR